MNKINQGTANLVAASSIRPEPINWLWQGWIARGKFTVLAGAGGCGKTTLLLDIIAIATRGGHWPDGTRCPGVGNVIIWSSEDDPEDTLVPRLMAARADLDRVHVLRGRTDNKGQVVPFDPSRDIDSLQYSAEALGNVRLIMLDPVVSAVAGDMHRANDVRRSLQPLVDLAAKLDSAVVGISHFSKGTAGKSPAERVNGSQAFSAFARTVLVAAKEEGTNNGVLAKAKSNISSDSGGIQYAVEHVNLEGGLKNTRVVWGDTVSGSAADILATMEGSGDNNERSSALNQAVDFLMQLLAEGALPSNQVKEEAKDAGVTWPTIRRAKDKIGIKPIRRGTEGKKGGGTWYWELPDSLRCSKPPEEPHHGQGEQLTESQQTRGLEGDHNVVDTLTCPTQKLEHLNQIKQLIDREPATAVEAEIDGENPEQFTV